MDIQVDTHRKTRGLPLVSYDPTIDFEADTRLQCHLSEKDLLAWADFHDDAPLEVAPYTYLDVIYFDGFAPEELAQLRAASKRYHKVYDATKGGLPALANHPPVSLNFKEGWKHVSVPFPQMGSGCHRRAIPMGSGDVGQRPVCQVKIPFSFTAPHRSQPPPQRPQGRQHHPMRHEGLWRLPHGE
jgi:hypothetical protein